MEIKRVETELDSIFQEDLNQFYDLQIRYVNLTTEDIEEAFNVAKISAILYSRWHSMAINAGKIALDSAMNKTEIRQFCEKNGSTLRLICDHARMIWSRGTDELNGREK